MKSYFIHIIIVLIMFSLGSCAGDDIYIPIGDLTPGQPTRDSTQTTIVFTANVGATNSVSKGGNSEVVPLPLNCYSQIFIFELGKKPGVDNYKYHGFYRADTPGHLTSLYGNLSVSPGLYSVYAVSTYNYASDKTPNVSSQGIATGLYNGMDYLWWEQEVVQVVAGQENDINILFLHRCVQLEINVIGSEYIKVDGIGQMDFSAPTTSNASWNLGTGNITGSYSLQNGNQLMTINGLTADGYMIPVTTTSPITVFMDVIIYGIHDWEKFDLPLPENNEYIGGNCYIYEVSVKPIGTNRVSAKLKNVRRIEK